MELVLALLAFIVGGTVVLLCIDWLSGVLTGSIFGLGKLLRRKPR